MTEVSRSYDAVAAAYDERFADELDGKPLDRLLLDLIAREAKGGAVADLGAGPGHVAAYLARRGARAIAIDLAPEMVARARARNLDARVGDLLALPLPDAGLAAAVLLYAIVHFEPADLPRVFTELARVLAPGAPALVGFHVGDEAIALTEFLGAAVDLTFRFFPLRAVVDAAERAGLAAEVTLERRPYPSEHPSTRGYLLLRRPIANASIA